MVSQYHQMIFSYNTLLMLVDPMHELLFEIPYELLNTFNSQVKIHTILILIKTYQYL